MNQKALISGTLALPGIALVMLWLVIFIVPALQSRDELIPLYQVFFFASLLAALATALWRWRMGSSWHANGALLVALASQGFNCCGFFYSIGKVARSM